MSKAKKLTWVLRKGWACLYKQNVREELKVPNKVLVNDICHIDYDNNTS